MPSVALGRSRVALERSIRALLAGALMLSLFIAEAPRTNAQEGRHEEIQSLLDRRAKAVREGDRTAFLATVGPEGSEFYTAQARWFDNIGGIPLANYELIADWETYGDLARGSDRNRYGSDVAIPRTIERYRIEGVDEKPVNQDLYLTFVEGSRGWTIRSDTDLDRFGFMTARSPWDFSPVNITRREGLMAIAGRCSGCPQAGGVLDVAHQALLAVDRHWREPWSRSVPIYVPQGSEQLARMIQATYPVDNYVAFAFWTGEEGQDPGSRIIVNPSGFDPSGDDRALSILTHEMFHVASLPSSGPFVPNFLEEGYAQLVQYDSSNSVIAGADALADGRIPSNYEFFVGDGAEVLGAYRSALSLVGFIEQRWGAASLREIYIRLGKRGIQPGTAPFHLDDVLQRVIGVGTANLERAWRDSIGR
jgi:hypothetical protein